MFHHMLMLWVSSDVWWPQKAFLITAANYWTSLLLQTAILLQRKKKVDILFHCMSFCLQFCNKLGKQKTQYTLSNLGRTWVLLSKTDNPNVIKGNSKPIKNQKLIFLSTKSKKKNKTPKKAQCIKLLKL